MVQLVNTSACHAEDRGFESRRNRHYGFIAQSVEQGTENPCVAGSIPAGATIYLIPFSNPEIVSYLPNYRNLYETYKTVVQNLDNSMIVKDAF